MDYTNEQRNICKTVNVPFIEAPSFLKVGINENVKTKLQPTNGLRHPLSGDTSGWYIWAGDKLPDRPYFFVPLHIEHLPEWSPDVMKFFGLPPGWSDGYISSRYINYIATYLNS